MLWKPPSWYKTRLTVKYTWNWWNALICCVSENPLSKISQEIPHPCVAQNTAKLGCWGQYFMFGPLSLVFASADAVCFSLVFWNMLRNFATKTLRLHWKIFLRLCCTFYQCLFLHRIEFCPRSETVLWIVPMHFSSPQLVWLLSQAFEPIYQRQTLIENPAGSILSWGWPAI